MVNLSVKEMKYENNRVLNGVHAEFTHIIFDQEDSLAKLRYYLMHNTLEEYFKTLSGLIPANLKAVIKGLKKSVKFMLKPFFLYH